MAHENKLPRCTNPFIDDYRPWLLNAVKRALGKSFENPSIEDARLILAAIERSMSSRNDCVKGRCFSPIACTGFGYCRELNFRDDLRQKLFDNIGAKSLALGLSLNETQVTALADCCLPILHDEREASK